jgi:hypothetical protein
MPVPCGCEQAFCLAFHEWRIDTRWLYHLGIAPAMGTPIPPIRGDDMLVAGKVSEQVSGDFLWRCFKKFFRISRACLNGERT